MKALFFILLVVLPSQRKSVVSSLSCCESQIIARSPKNYINFKRNSTIFVKGEKEFLENAITFLKTIKNDWDTFVITAHNSAIERNKVSLCNKRLAKMTRILVKNGIQESIIQREIKTDTELRNRCKKGVACSKEEHQINQNVTLRLQ